MDDNINSSLGTNNNFDVSLLKIEKNVEMLEYKLKREIPNELADRMIIIEKQLEALVSEVGKHNFGYKFGSIEKEIEVLKKEVTTEKSRTRERIAFIAVIVSLGTYLASVVLQGGT